MRGFFQAFRRGRKGQVDAPVEVAGQDLDAMKADSYEAAGRSAPSPTLPSATAGGPLGAFERDEERPGDLAP